jgi:hypothetical protein
MRHGRLVVAFAVAGALALVGAALMAACSGNSTGSTVPKDPSSVGKSTGGTTGGPSPTVPGPASKYSPSLKDLSGLYTVNVPDTFTQNITTFASSYLFPNNQQGSDLASQWKIIDGYKVSYEPDGLAAGEVKGGYYVTVEVYLFQDTNGAGDAYTYMADFFSKGPGAEKDDTKGLGNSSAAYHIIHGTVGPTDTPEIYHSFIFRRGNVVTVVRTQGAQGLVTIDRARDVAVIVDDRILGHRDATAPTPIPTPKISLPPTEAPTAVKTP